MDVIQEMISKMREVLQDQYIHLSVVSYTVQEHLNDGVCNISCQLEDNAQQRMIIEGEGVGTIDALFDGLKKELAPSYPSLNSIEFSLFEIKGLMSAEDKVAHTSQAQAEATVGILNSEGREFIFKATANSISQPGIVAMLNAAEYFVNSEKTFVRLYDIVEHYKRENRMELVQKYTSLMAQVVENTSYSEVVEQLRKQMP